MYTAETAVAHDEQVIARARNLGDRTHKIVNPVETRCPFAKRRERLFWIPPKRALSLARAVAENQVGLAQAARQKRFHRPEFHRVRPRLQDRKNPCSRADFSAQASNGRCDRRGVMSEVIVDGNAAALPARLHTPL